MKYLRLPGSRHPRPRSVSLPQETPGRARTRNDTEKRLQWPCPDGAWKAAEYVKSREGVAAQSDVDTAPTGRLRMGPIRGERRAGSGSPPGTHGSARGAGSRRGQGVRDVRPAEAQLVLGTSPLSRREVSEFGQRHAALWPAPRSGPRASSSSSQWPASTAAGPLARPQAPDPRPWSFALSKAHEGAGQPVTCSSDTMLWRGACAVPRVGFSRLSLLTDVPQSGRAATQSLACRRTRGVSVQRS